MHLELVNFFHINYRLIVVGMLAALSVGGSGQRDARVTGRRLAWHLHGIQHAHAQNTPRRGTRPHTLCNQVLTLFRVVM